MNNPLPDVFVWFLYKMMTTGDFPATLPEEENRLGISIQTTNLRSFSSWCLESHNWWGACLASRVPGGWFRHIHTGSSVGRSWTDSVCLNRHRDFLKNLRSSQLIQWEFAPSKWSGGWHLSCSASCDNLTWNGVTRSATDSKFYWNQFGKPI